MPFSLGPIPTIWTAWICSSFRRWHSAVGLSITFPQSLAHLSLPGHQSDRHHVGYNFTSLSHILPFLEYGGTGISSLWARSRALKHNCHVVVGFPEQVDVSDRWPTSPEYYNSAIIVSNEGEMIGTYRKHFLYMIDETWALEGPGFGKDYIPGLGQTAMGICECSNPVSEPRHLTIFP